MGNFPRERVAKGEREKEGNRIEGMGEREMSERQSGGKGGVKGGGKSEGKNLGNDRGKG